MKRIALGLAALAVTAGIAMAAGQFAGLPIIGKGSYCQGTSTGATGNQVCSTTVPAGPQSLTSTMLIPADTGFANGAQPQTVYVPAAMLGSLPPLITAPLTGTTVNLTSATNQYIATPAGTIAALTVNLPAAATMTEGQKMGVTSTQTITALTMGAGTGNTIAATQTPTALTVASPPNSPSGFTFVFHALTYANGVPATGIWYRVV